MTYIELKKKLDQMSEEQLKQQITFREGEYAVASSKLSRQKKTGFVTTGATLACPSIQKAD